MGKTRSDGAAGSSKASIKEAIGKLIGDTKLEAEGADDKLAGKDRSGRGKTMNTARRSPST